MTFWEWIIFLQEAQWTDIEKKWKHTITLPTLYEIYWWGRRSKKINQESDPMAVMQIWAATLDKAGQD